MTDLLPEKWMKGVAVTTTVLAVMTAIASSRGAVFGAKIQLLTAGEGSQWSYYQAKSIKHNLLEVEADQIKGVLLGPVTSEQKNFYDAKLISLEQDITRYDKEKNEIRAQAENTGKENAVYNRKANQIGFSIVIFQIAIMLSSVSALVKRKEMWIAGIVFGLAAAVYLANGLFLFF